MVLRDGKKVGIYRRDEIDIEKLIRLMINQDYRSFFGGGEERVIQPDPILEVRGLAREPYFRDIDLTLNRGEIVGIAGIIGCGKNELCQSLYGVHRPDCGEVFLEGRQIAVNDPSEVKKRGILFLPENRKTQGLFLNDTVSNNMIACVLDKVSHRGFLDHPRIVETSNRSVAQLDIKLRSLDQIVRFLSGGNQQKVLVAKSMAAAPKVIIAIDPTRGIDVGSKADIHRILNGLTRAGMAILMISSELDELIHMCDRIEVMNGGKIIESFSRGQFDTERILLAMHRSIEQGVIAYGAK